MLNTIKKEHRNLDITDEIVKQHLWVFVNCLIENPSFDSPTKDNMTLKASSFGSHFDLNDKFLNDVIKIGIVDRCVSFAKAREGLLAIPNLYDASNARTKNSTKCTLILTYGELISLAKAGVEIVGRDNYGLNKLKYFNVLNVRAATKRQITKNYDFMNIIQILGLQVDETYKDIKSL